MPFDVVALIVNPNSKRVAQLMRRVEGELPYDLDVLTLRTKDMSHAEQEVRQLVHDHKHPLIISVSGDGGANHVYDTAYGAKLESGHEPVVALLPGGDANDHFRALFDLSLKKMIKLIIEGKERALDLIEIRYGNKTRRSHSYAATAGFQAAMTARYNLINEQAREEGRRRLSLPGQVREIARNRHLAQPFTVRWPDGSEEELLNLSVHNVDGMAKLTHPAPDADPSDGQLELVKLTPRRRGHFRRVVGHGIKSVPRLVKAEAMPDPLKFTLVDGGHLQFDGEDDWIDPETEIEFTCLPGALLTLAQ